MAAPATRSTTAITAEVSSWVSVVDGWLVIARSLVAKESQAGLSTRMRGAGAVPASAFQRTASVAEARRQGTSGERS
jgi:hypothetical protein